MKPFSFSHPQRRIWYMENQDPDTAVNILSFYVACNGVDPAILTSAIHRCLEANDGLRLQVHRAPDDEFGVNQAVVPFVKTDLEHKHFKTMKMARGWMKEVSAKPFQLFASPLCKFHIITTDDQQQPGYFFKIHHLISDGATCLSIAYQIENSCKQEKSPVPFVSYEAFVEEEKRYKGSESFKADKTFWMRELATFPEKVSFLSMAQMEQSGAQSASKSVKRVFDATLRRKIHDYAKAHDLSVYKIILSGLGLYISKGCRLHHFGIGLANHNRAEKRFQMMAGMFVSSMPFLFQIDPAQTFEEYSLATGSKVNTLLKEHSRYPFDVLATDMRKEYGEDISHLLNINLVGHPDMEGLPDMENMTAGEAFSDLAIHINVDNKDRDGVLELLFILGASLQENDVDILFNGLSALLEHGLEQPTTAIGDLSMVTREEQEHLLGLNGSFVPYRHESLPTLLREQVRSRGDQPALACDGVELSYEELDSWSDRIGQAIQKQYLKETGEVLAPGAFIGLSMNRGKEMIATIWGILKVGAAYVPLDPAYPEERLQYIVADAGIHLAVIHKEYSPLFENIDTIHIDDISPLPSADEAACDSLELCCHADDFAYVIYTSGTTGKPKGVPIRHHQVVNVATAFGATCGVKEESRVIQFASLNFDASVVEIFPVVIAGACLCVALEKHRTDGEAFCELLERERITTTFIPPAMLAVMPRRDLPLLECLFVGGESTDPAAIRFWSAKRRMVNGYGPTEVTVVTTACTFQVDSRPNDIGPPWQNVTCYVLDEQRNLLPVGIAGELYIGGVQVSDGYLNRPELNEACFIPNPFAEQEGSQAWNSRLYKSGDLVRWLDSGHIEFIGRVDFQVKIRGHRIECGEVSTIISDLKGVRSCLVIPHASGATKRLVAYVIMNDGGKGTEDLRFHATQALPEYMVPSAFVALDSFPMTPNGKIDRRRLPEPTYNDTQGTVYGPPTTETERILCEIWMQLLDLEQVGIDDDFFDIGGDSLLAMSLISKASDQGLPLQLAMIRKQATVTALAKELDGMNGAAAHVLPPLIKQNITGTLPPPLNALMMHRQNRSMEAAGVVLAPLLSTWKLTGGVHVDSLCQVVDELVAHHQGLRTALIEDGEQVMLNFLPKGEVCELVRIMDDDQLSISLEHFRNTRSAGQLLCAFRLYQLTPNQYVLAFLSDHLVLDAWAMHQVMDELSSRYNALCAGQEFKGEDEPYQLSDFSAWYSGLLTDGTLTKSKDYWQTTLKDVSPALITPPQPDLNRNYYEAVECFFPFPTPLRESFHKLCKEEKCTPFEGYFSLYMLLLCIQTGQSDVVSSYVTALRDRSELQGIVGCLTNRLYIRASLNPEDSFQECLAQVRPKMIAASEHNLWPVWHDMDPQGHGFPNLFFHYFPEKGGVVPDLHGLQVEASPMEPLAHWPLPMVMQVLDDATNPALMVVGHAGFIDKNYAEQMIEDYLHLLKNMVDV